MVRNKIKDELYLENFIKERIDENERLFTEEELTIIKNNKEVVKKIYMLGFINSTDCYEM